LPPEQLIRSERGNIIWIVVPVNYIGSRLDSASVDDIGMVAYDQFAASVIRLPATREIFRAVDPKHSQVYVRGVSGADLEDFGKPVLYGLGGFIYVGLVGFLDEHGLADFELLRGD
jgi:hypothetical protein